MSSKRKKILIFVNRYIPGYKSGGPIRSIENLVNALSSKFDFYIITQDRDGGDNRPYDNVTVNEWNKKNGTYVYYTNSITLKKYSLLIKERSYHKIYLNSLFNFKFSIIPLLVASFYKMSKSIIIAPRGELSKGALSLKSNKKYIYLKLADITNIYKNVSWQVSSIYEEQEIQSIIKFPNAIYIVENIPGLSNFSDTTNRINITKNFVMNIVYLSRITPKKNLIYCLNVLSNLSIPINFNIYGHIDDNSYWNKCKKIMSLIPDNINIIYHGPILNSLVPEVFSQSHLFFLPTLGENYGHAIVESLLAGTPVLISDKTPWRNLQQSKVGWDIDLKDKEQFINTIRHYYYRIIKGNSLDPESVRSWILNEIDYNGIIDKYIDMFES